MRLKKKHYFCSVKRWNKDDIIDFLKQYVLNKYVLTLIAFGLIMLFAGDQGIIRRIHRARQIRVLERQRDRYDADIQAAKHEIEALHNRDSLERYAREKCLMHEENEDVYLIEEE